MKCPFCNGLNTKVTDSRDTEDGSSIRRRRQCLSCGRRFTTYETVEFVPLRVVKRSGLQEMFDRNKVRNGIVRACEKRNVSSEQIEAMVRRIEGIAREGGVQEVTSERIGDLVMEELRKTDQVAYVRFASVYRRFQDIGSFMNELESLMKKEEARKDSSDKGEAQ